MAITGLVGVAVFTSADRFQRMRRFYVEHLGLPVRSDRPGFVNFDWNGIRLTVAVHSGLVGPNPEPRHVMINLGVEDVVAEIERLQAVGVPVIRSPEPESWGGWVATVTDPDGNYVQLLQFPE